MRVCSGENNKRVCITYFVLFTLIFIRMRIDLWFLLISVIQRCCVNEHLLSRVTSTEAMVRWLWSIAAHFYIWLRKKSLENNSGCSKRLDEATQQSIWWNHEPEEEQAESSLHKQSVMIQCGRSFMHETRGRAQTIESHLSCSLSLG